VIIPAYLNSPGASGTEAVEQSREPLERTTPVAKSVPPHPRKRRPHHGSVDQQLEALDWLVTSTAAELAAIKNALVVMGILPEPAETARPSFPRDLVDPAGFPSACHPEALEAELPEPDEEWLASVAADLWPADEYDGGDVLGGGS
jgi:hypothetical protein